MNKGAMNSQGPAMWLQLGDGICIHVLLRRKGQANAAPELRVVTLREMCRLWRECFYEYDFAVQDAESGEEVRLTICTRVPEEFHEGLLYIPTRQAEDSTQAGVEKIAAYEAGLSAEQHRLPGPPSQGELLWHCVDEDVQLLLPQTEEWVRAGNMEYPACVPFGCGFLTMKGQHGYTWDAPDTPWGFHWVLPTVCELVLERMCTLHIEVGTTPAERFSLLVRGLPQEEPTEEDVADDD